MSRALSAALRQALYAPQTDAALLELLIIEHPNLSSTLRVVNNAVNIISNFQTFVATRFTLTLPTERDAAPQATLAIDAVNRTVIEVVRQLADSPSITIQLVLASTPDTVELEIPNLELTGVQYDAGTLQGTLSFQDVLSEPYPGDLFAPYWALGIFNTVAP